MSEKNWYEGSGWYEAAGENKDGGASAASPQPPVRPVKQGWTKPRVIGALVLLLALIIGTSLAFAVPKDASSFAFIWGADKLPFGDDGEMPEDWEDFFDDYYIMEDPEIGESLIPMIELSEGPVLETGELPGEILSLQQLYENCADTIVAIYGNVEGEGYSWGTGVIISEDGLIITNAHVVDGCDSADVVLADNSEYEAKLVGSDPISDIAVLKIKAEGLRAAVFGDSTLMKVGDEVAAIGNPLGESFRSTLTNGIISSIDRGININGHSMLMLQTNAAINEGNSGGALFNMYGQIVGITNMKMVSTFSTIEGIGLAIPSNTALKVANALIKDGEYRGRPSLGIVIGAVPEEAAEHYDLPHGLYVSEVKENSDAAAQGIMAGDIIVEVNFEPAESADQINAIKNTLEVGDIMMFKVWRDGEYLEFEVMLMDTNDIY